MIRDRSPDRRQPPCVPELVTSGRGSVGMYASVQLEAAPPTAERENPMQRLRAADDFVAIRAGWRNCDASAPTSGNRTQTNRCAGLIGPRSDLSASQTAFLRYFAAVEASLSTRLTS